MRSLMVLATLVMLSGCDNFVPREKTAQYDPIHGDIIYPHPCPDWSQSQTQNYINERHSNYGCATNTNTALQLAYPQDLMEGHGDDTPNTEATTHILERWRRDEIPVPLQPMQSSN